MPTKREREAREMTKIRVWGLAQGWRSTTGAARGAFAWREYETESFPLEDWIRVIKVEKL